MQRNTFLVILRHQDTREGFHGAEQCTGYKPTGFSFWRVRILESCGSGQALIDATWSWGLSNRWPFCAYGCWNWAVI